MCLKCSECCRCCHSETAAFCMHSLLLVSGTPAGVLDRAQSERLLFLELLHMLAENSTVCNLLTEALAAAPDTTQPQEDSAGLQPAQEPSR